MTETFLLLGERGVLPGQRGHRLYLTKPETEQVGLAGPFPGMRHHVEQLPLHRGQSGVAVGPAVQQVGDLGAAEAVQRFPLSLGLEQPVLVGLAVHRDQGLGHLGQRGRGHGGPAHEGAGPPLAGDVAGDDHSVVLHLAAEPLDGVGERGEAARVDHALNAGGPRATADRAAVSAAAEQQPQRGHDHGLARTCLTGDHGESRSELER